MRETAENFEPVRQVICLHALLPWSVCFQSCAAHCFTRFPRSTHLLRQDELALFFSQFAVDYHGEGELVSADRGQLKPRRLQIKGTGTPYFGAGGRPASSSRIKGRA